LFSAQQQQRLHAADISLGLDMSYIKSHLEACTVVSFGRTVDLLGFLGADVTLVALNKSSPLATSIHPGALSKPRACDPNDGMVHAENERRTEARLFFASSPSAQLFDQTSVTCMCLASSSFVRSVRINGYACIMRMKTPKWLVSWNGLHSEFRSSGVAACL
jgi:hypothetical protein